MTDLLREHRPLLREDHSDEEFQREFRPPPRHMGYKGKARNTVKGAAAVIKNWPDYWSSSVTYWWIGIGMFSLMTFVLYSSVVTYSLLPVTNSIPVPQHVTERNNNLPEVFMHVIVNNEKEVEVNKYLPYIEIIANKYLHYQFNLIFVINDTIKTEQGMNHAQINNEDAMNSLWTQHDVLDDNVLRKAKSNIIVQHTTLSSYLDGSPVQQYWKQLPNQLIGFLVRAVSIWDKGGIAFSPIILTPRSPDAIYIEKLYSLLTLYEEHKKLNVTTNINKQVKDTKIPKTLNNQKRKYKKKVNNIRDIIDALETDPPEHQDQLEALTEAEGRQEITELEMEPSNNAVAVVSNSYSFNQTSKSGDEGKQIINDHSTKNSQSKISNYILPSFMDFLFHDKSNRTTHDESTDINPLKRSTRTVSTESPEQNINTGNIIQPMIISAPTKFEKVRSDLDNNALRGNDVDNLTIDLRGNIVATKSSCHAFLGSVFSNVKHRTEEDSLKEFIITELSLFCNGLLSTCKGIDVILL